jgi:hypothetical protein
MRAESSPGKWKFLYGCFAIHSTQSQSRMGLSWRRRGSNGVNNSITTSVCCRTSTGSTVPAKMGLEPIKRLRTINTLNFLSLHKKLIV